jgi:hypothetical protein
MLWKNKKADGRFYDHPLFNDRLYIRGINRGILRGVQALVPRVPVLWF